MQNGLQCFQNILPLAGAGAAPREGRRGAGSPAHGPSATHDITSGAQRREIALEVGTLSCAHLPRVETSSAGCGLPTAPSTVSQPSWRPSRASQTAVGTRARPAQASPSCPCAGARAHACCREPRLQWWAPRHLCGYTFCARPRPPDPFSARF